MDIKQYLAEIGARGGRAKSQAKIEAARQNLARARAKLEKKKRGKKA